MKTLFLSLLTVLLFVDCCQRAEAMSSSGIRSEIRCEAGYKFLYVWYRAGKVVTVTQIYEGGEYGENRPPQPMKCN